MKSILGTYVFITALSSFSLSSFAQIVPCTSVATATLDNIQSCAKTVKEEIWQKHAAELTLQNLKDKIFVLEDKNNDLYYSGASVDNQICATVSYNFDATFSSFENGVFGLMSKKCSKLNKPADWYTAYNQRKFWKGSVIQANPFDYSNFFVLKQVYPLSVSEARAVIDSSSSRAWQKVDALASVLVDLPEPSQATIIIDFMTDVGVRSSNNISGLFKKLLAMQDLRTYKVLLDILNDKITRAQDIRPLLEIVVDDNNFLKPELLNFVAEKLSVLECGHILTESLISFAKHSNMPIRNGVAGLLSRCVTALPEQQYFGWYNAAMRMIAEKKIMSGLLPIIELLNKQKDSLELANMTEGFIKMLITAIDTLSLLQSERALNVLKSDTYYNSKHYPQISQATRKAVANIETGLQCGKIRKGDLSAIRWGFEIISMYNGSRKAQQMQILDAYKIAIKLSVVIKKEITTFIKEELDLEVHAYDPELVEKMQSIIN